MSDLIQPIDHKSYLNNDTLDLLFDLMDGDSEMIVDLVDTLIDTTPELLDDLKSGVYSKNPQKIRDSAHALKSSNAQLGAESFAMLCEQMESKARQEDVDEVDQLLDLILAEFEKVRAALGSWKNSLA
ncbi:MAG: Hpt domain-containing protein [Bacteroidia bacterium]|nr:Hpt domain-containing protein [Bacteroidia bacterium]